MGRRLRAIFGRAIGSSSHFRLLPMPHASHAHRHHAGAVSLRRFCSFIARIHRAHRRHAHRADAVPSVSHSANLRIIRDL